MRIPQSSRPAPPPPNVTYDQGELPGIVVKSNGRGLTQVYQEKLGPEWGDIDPQDVILNQRYEN